MVSFNKDDKTFKRTIFTLARYADRQTERQTDRQTERQTDTQQNQRVELVSFTKTKKPLRGLSSLSQGTQTDRKIDRQTERQTEKKRGRLTD